MGIFDWFGERKAAKALDLTVEQYREFKEFEASDKLTIWEYRAYLKDAADRMGLRAYLNLHRQENVKSAGATAPAKAVSKPAAVKQSDIISPESTKKSDDESAVVLPLKHTITKEDVPLEAKPMIIPEGVCEIEPFAFNEARCTSIVIPGTIKKVGMYAFSDAVLLKTVKLNEGFTEIGESMFSKCNALENINWPESLIKIGKNAFYSCKLKNIQLPDGLQSIGNCAFAFCEALEKVYVPDSVTDLHEHAFLACNDLREISLPFHLKDVLASYFPCKIRVDSKPVSATVSSGNGSVSAPAKTGVVSAPAKSGVVAPSKAGAVSAPVKSGVVAPSKAGVVSGPAKSGAVAPSKAGAVSAPVKSGTTAPAKARTASSIEKKETKQTATSSAISKTKGDAEVLQVADIYIYDGCWSMDVPAGCQVNALDEGWELRSAGETVFAIEKRVKPITFKNGKTLVMRDDAQMQIRVRIPASYARYELMASVSVGKSHYSVQMKWDDSEIEDAEAVFRYELFMRTVGSIKLPGEDCTNGYHFEQMHPLLPDVQVAFPGESKIGKGKELFNDGKIRVTVTKGPVAETREKADAAAADYHRLILGQLSDAAWTETFSIFMDCSKYLIADAACKKKRLLVVTDPNNNRQVMLCVEDIDSASNHEKDAAFFAKCMYDSIVLTPKINYPVAPVMAAPDRLSAYPSERMMEKMYHMMQASRDKSITELDNGVTVQSFNMRSDIDLRCTPIRRVLVEHTTTLQMNDEQWEQARMMGLAQEDDLPYMASARKYAEVFRVNRDVFDFRHDRENEIMEGCIESHSDLHSLCSFAYAMEYARRAIPGTEEQKNYIVAYAQSTSGERLSMPWSYASGLCNAPDCYVAYVREQNIQQISGNGWTYVSLEALQRDLAALQPTMEQIHQLLSAGRDHSEALGDPLSDLLYVWCTLALASKEPFVILEGPTHCSFKWLGDPAAAVREPSMAENFYEIESRHLVRQLGVSKETRQMGTKSASAAIKVGLAMQDPEAAEYARAHLDEDAVVSFAGKHFVLSGYEDNMEGEEAQQIKAHGGILHSKMVKSADYLVVRLETCGRSKLNKALEWREKGSRVQIISDEMLKEALY